MEVEIVYAAADKQIILPLNVPEGATILQVINISGINLGTAADFAIGPDFAVGIFGKIRSLDWPVKTGDRIEIYHPLKMDPMTARLERAKKHKLIKPSVSVNAPDAKL